MWKTVQVLGESGQGQGCGWDREVGWNYACMGKTDFERAMSEGNDQESREGKVKGDM
jgi:hypothetical protein